MTHHFGSLAPVLGSRDKGTALFPGAGFGADGETVGSRRLSEPWARVLGNQVGVRGSEDAAAPTWAGSSGAPGGLETWPVWGWHTGSSGVPKGRACPGPPLRVIGNPGGRGMSGASMQRSPGEGTGLVAWRDGQWSISAQPALKAQGGGVSGVEGAGRGPLSPQQSSPPSESCSAGIQGPRTWQGLQQP